MFNICVDNFRGFQNESFDISKINILIGENSGGKSSFLKLLLLLQQSMDSTDKDRKIILDGSILDLGAFDKVINHASEGDSFTVSLKTGDEYIKSFADFMMLQRFDDLEQLNHRCGAFWAEPVTLSFTFSKSDNESFSNHIKIYSKNIGALSIRISEEFSTSFQGVDEVEGELVLERENKEDVLIKNNFTKHGFMLFASAEEIVEYDENHQNDQLLEELVFLLFSQNYLLSILKKVKYINPVEFHPTRIGLKRDRSINKTIRDYESLVNVLSSLSDSQEESSMEILQKFNCAVCELGIADEIKLETNDILPVSEIKVKISGVWNSIVDVGYGVGLQVPIILQAIISEVEGSDDILIIEQPEIHLHPALHAKFIEVLIKYSGNTRLIIETHSEHIIRKLQVLVRKDEFDAQDVNIYYFKNDKGVFVVSNHKIEKSGQLLPTFPEGFYDNSYNLSRELY